MLFSQEKRKVMEIPIGRINPNPSQPRRNFSQRELEELAESIKENGLLQPLTVRKVNGAYELIAGERRLRACFLAEMKTVPCLVSECDNRQSAIFAILENLQRQDLQLFEEAEGIQHLIKDWGITQEEAAARLGKSQSSLANKMRLLKLNPEERKRIIAAELTERHARALIRIDDEKVRNRILTEVIEKGLNVKQTDQLVEEVLAEKKGKPVTKKRFVVKDIRIFMNAINHAVETMRISVINAITERKETDDYIECIVRIPKSGSKSLAGRKPA